MAQQFRKQEAARVRQARQTRQAKTSLFAVDEPTRDAYNAALSRVAWRQELGATRKYGVPPYLVPDATRALQDQRATTLVSYGSSPQSDRGRRTVTMRLEPWKEELAGGGTWGQHLQQRYSKTGNLTVYRHEVGHIMPDALARTARIVGIDPKDPDLYTAAYREYVPRAVELARLDGDSFASPNSASVKKILDRLVPLRVTTFFEEVRAWRNAARFGKGRLRLPVMERALTSHATGIFGDELGGTLAATAAAHLRRYVRTVRRRRPS